MFEKTYKEYLELNDRTKDFLHLFITGDRVSLQDTERNRVYVGKLSASGGALAHDVMKNFELLCPVWFAKWNK